MTFRYKPMNYQTLTGLTALVATLAAPEGTFILKPPSELVMPWMFFPFTLIVTEGRGLPVLESLIVPDISRVCAITTELNSSKKVRNCNFLIAQLFLMIKKINPFSC